MVIPSTIRTGNPILVVRWDVPNTKPTTSRCVYLRVSGGPSGIRTRDQPIKSPAAPPSLEGNRFANSLDSPYRKGTGGDNPSLTGTELSEAPSSVQQSA